MKTGSRALPSARVRAPASRNSLTSRSCRVLCARSTRPLAELELAQMMSMFNACNARPNWVIPSPPSAPRMVDAEDAMLVAVERHRLAPGLQVGARRIEISKGRLALDKLEVHQSAGRVIDEHQQGALRPAILEPPMLAAIDLHQLANTLAPGAGLMNLLAPLLAVSSNPSLDHP